jgi:hypothetical protein
MNSNKLQVNKLLIFALLTSIFLVSTPMVYAQVIQDWSEPINLSNSGASTDPLIIVGTDDVIRVIWIDEFDGYKYTDSVDGIEWTSPKVVDFPFSPDDAAPKFEVTANGVIHVFWIDDENRFFYAQTLQANFDAPGSWRSQARLGNDVADYDFVAENADRLHVSYIMNSDTENEPAGVYYRQSLNGGSSWTGSLILFESPYFRSLAAEDAHVRVAAASGNADTGNVYVVWDNPALKRIVMIRSIDRGQNWETPFEVIGPDQNSGFEAPFKVEIESINEGILLTWQAGESGIRCSQYSIWSVDGGDQWGEAIRIFDELGSCPRRIGFATSSEGYGVAVLNIEENLAMIAWNGNAWSNLQIQNGLSSLLNPVTLDSILFRCQRVSIRDGKLFAVGCDEGNSKDIWFSSRSLGTIDNWFPPPSAWSAPHTIINVSEKISSISSVADINNEVHTVWAQSPSFEDDSEPTIYYALWDGAEWSRPAQIMVTNGSPVDLSLTADNQGRLFLAWVNQENGDLLFSWGNSNRADIPLEWASPKILPSLAKLNSSPEILVDSSGNIIVVYAVTLNENRGIYMARSDNLGETWSAPLKIFDAVSSEWDAVDRPKLALTSDGKLHTLFSRYSVSGKTHPIGLYYSQSVNGGTTWSNPMEISNKPVIWYQILVGKDQALNLLWQEGYDQASTNLHRLSNDNGVTWNNPTVVSSTRAELVSIDSGIDLDGQLHLLQLIGGDELMIQEWVSDGLRWSAKESGVIFRNTEDSIPLEFMAEIAPNGYLGILTILETRTTDSILDYTLTGFGRDIDMALPVQPLPSAVVPPVALPINLTAVPDVQYTPTFPSPLVGVDNPASLVNKNAVGVIMIIVVLIILVVVIRPRKSNK